MTHQPKQPRVVVKVELVDRRWQESYAKWESIYRATCHTGDCLWAYEAWPKVAVDEQARWHREQHRAVNRLPKTPTDTPRTKELR